MSCSIFILIFEPFEIENQTGEWYVDLIIFSLGIIFFLSILLIEFLVPKVIPKLFENWNFGKAILWYAWVILFVGAVMFTYKSYLGGFRDFTWMEYFSVLGRILIIGITVSFFTLGVISYLNRQRFSLISSNENYKIKAPNSKSIRLNLNNVMYIVSDDNYVDIHLNADGKREKIVFRSSLKNIESQIVTSLTPIYRCHRRHLINIKFFEIKKNTSRNVKIQLINYDDEIPVSKQYADLIVSLLQVRP
ncbi:LytTR family DNA-binding domain-containing protein [Sediminicola sp. YIK13]|uniref:LytTR family DNA-binding domain-containing protein n=1 Tax=Sediminicola sp. YIK13 TaxID=1453352 RepID=UPI001F32FB24|nr:LytTR family DNA-binding domain-containing protein [Sediminicola sp. YIK13]